MDALSVLLGVYAVILLFNSLMSGYVWYSYKRSFYSLPFLLWVFLAINFIAQGVFQELNFSMVLAFATYFPCSLILTKFVNSYVKDPSKKGALPKRYYYVAAVALFGAIMVNHLTQSFVWSAFIISVGIAYPMLEAGLSLFPFSNFKKADIFTKSFSIILIVNALHFLDYAFLRSSSIAPVYGFSLALLLVFGFSILIPSFSIKRYEKEYSRRLEKEVVRKTDQLHTANRRLSMINAELESKNEELEEAIAQNRALVSIVCHDIANPLAIAKMNIDLVTNKIVAISNNEPSINNSIQRIEKSTTIISSILSQVRSLNAMEYGKMNLELEPVDVACSVEEAVSLFEDRFRDKSIRLNISDRREAKDKILANPTTLVNQIFINILSNAIKFTHEGGKIDIVMEEVNDRVRLSIKDNGIGMSKELSLKLFDFESNSSRQGTSGEKGTGFGLPIVKKCMEQFGAEINVISRCKDEAPSGQSGTSFLLSFQKAAA